MPTESRPVRVRIAPSPTGDPHVGTAYIALFNYVFAKKHGGSFVLRIEDTDQTRARSDSEQMIFDALRWVGLTWDEGPDVGGPYAPYRQSERTHFYRDQAGVLLERGAAYRCFCTEDRLAKLRIQQQAEKRSTLGYDRHCRELDPSESRNRAAAGEPHVIRMKMPITGKIAFHDELRGAVERDADNFDDQVLLKTDGFPTYHMANVVDDHLMQITHVIRAEEWVSSTGKHVVLYDAFGWERPKFIHMPLLRNADKNKTKISKRKNPVSINYYKDAGILPHTLLNFLGLMGWSFGGEREKFTLAEMVDVFSWDRMSLGGPVFDLKKLTWLNEQYIKDLSNEQLAEELVAWRFNKEFLAKLMPLARDRIKRFDDLIPLTEYFFSGDLDYKPVLANMTIPDVAPKDLATAVLELVEKLEARDGWEAATIEQEITAWTVAHGWKNTHMLLRCAVTGRTASPGLYDTMAVLGKETTRRRLRMAADAILASAPPTPKAAPAPKAPAPPKPE